MLIDSHFFCVQVNPPYYVRLVELVPHPETAAGVMSSTQAVMTKVQESCNNKEQRHVQWMLMGSATVQRKHVASLPKVACS